MDDVMDPAAGSLLRAKLMPPQAVSDNLLRPQLEAALCANVHARVLLLAAPAGFGKTSALAALARLRKQQGQHVAWLSLGPGDDAPSRFLLQLIEALCSALPNFGGEALAYLQNTMRVPVAAVMESLLAELAQLEVPLLLVVDDLHLIQDAELLAALNRLIKFAPDSFTLAIGSRSQPALNLATLRAKDLLVEIGEQELRLSKAETRDYLQRSGLQLDAVAFSALYSQTEGWMVGVHLASLWLRHQPQAAAQIADMGTDQVAVGNYLLRSVFEQLPVQKQELLLALGIAQQLSGDLANALTGREDGQQLLEELECETAWKTFQIPGVNSVQ